jgi:F0F1-type ATP synthase membrane subunit b/b'
MEKNDQLFIQLLYIFQASAMQALGKIKSPITGKIEKNIEQAKQSIEMLEMLKEKTKNNLSDELIKALDTFLSEVRLNYVEEMNKN